MRRYRHTPVLNVWENVQNRLLQSIYQSEEQKHRLTCIGKVCVEIFDRLGDSDTNEREAFDSLGNIILLEQTMVTGVEWQVRPGCREGRCPCFCALFFCWYERSTAQHSNAAGPFRDRLGIRKSRPR